MKRVVLWFGFVGALIPILLVVLHVLETPEEFGLPVYESTYGVWLWPASILLQGTYLSFEPLGGDYSVLFFLAILIGSNVALYAGAGLLLGDLWRFVRCGRLTQLSIGAVSAWIDRRRVKIWVGLITTLLVVWTASLVSPEGIFAMAEGFAKMLVVVLIGPAFAVGLAISGTPHVFTLPAVICALTVFGLEMVGIAMLVRFLYFNRKRVVAKSHRNHTD